MNLLVKLSHILLLIALISCIGCQQSSNSKTDAKILSQEEFTKCLTEYYVLEAAFNNKAFELSQRDSLTTLYHLDILHRFGITSEDFKENLKFYTDKPMAMEEIHNMVVDILQKRKDTVL